MSDAEPTIPGLPPVVGASSRPDLGRSAAQTAHEQVMREVAEALSNIEQAIRRADRARRAVARDADPNVTVALEQTVAQLERVRQDLFQQAYFGGAQQRLA